MSNISYCDGSKCGVMKIHYLVKNMDIIIHVIMNHQIIFFCREDLLTLFYPNSKCKDKEK